ncbi:hypothetical protein B566_EDAN009268 [Ephemera danica]|nr:hypothetical protein B566_EDAN009268 [Ephemera danica]
MQFQAINGHLSIAHAYFAHDEDLMQELITVGEWKKKYEFECGKFKEPIPQSNYAGYAYDAVWTYAYALDKLIKTNQSHIADLHSPDSTRNFVKFIESTDFNGVSGHISFREGPSRVSLINVVQWYNNESFIVGTYYPNNTGNGTGLLNLNVSAIRWVTADGKQPDDGTEPPPTCFVSPLADFFNTSCEIAIVIINLLGFGILGTILLLTFILMKRRYEKMTEKYMRSMGIDLLPNAASLASLDKWEIAREHVVINRKLGEGAFGTVYGGEANFPDKGWVAVAVKTLKVGSTTEVKLDFLSEAEVMKRLDHQNIVRLLGVCTKNEPVYTIMEFMLYGDLKTFLLARRHLVTERSTEESDEISSKKLTNMALDVARALTYLADLKYVHRDVACRNCMVNANRVVKLGDFGMTRAMYESDYYKFNRKGMLPVRWMAPESLGLGIFTPQSDIWSYGVLLYEIITFGSFPFQGMSNSQVLEFVKNGNTLTIPKGVKSQLENLLKSCWLPEHKNRPNASEIVEFLANNPRLIAPCLDVPLASVQMEDTGQLELQLPEKSRKCSVSLKTRHRSLSGGSHAATTPNSPTSIEPSTKLARSATTQDVMQAIPLLPAPPNNARHASTSSSTSPDTVPLLSTSMMATEVDLIRPAIQQSVTVPILPPPPSRNVDFIQGNGGPLSPHRRLSGTLPLTKYVGYPNQRPIENGGVDYQTTSVL